MDGPWALVLVPKFSFGNAISLEIPFPLVPHPHHLLVLHIVKVPAKWNFVNYWVPKWEFGNQQKTSRNYWLLLVGRFINWLDPKFDLGSSQ